MAVKEISLKNFLNSIPVLNRCVPKPVKEIAESVLRDFYGLLNSWDTLEQILGDLYNTWKELLFLSVFALSKYFFYINFYLFMRAVRIKDLRSAIPCNVKCHIFL